MIKNKKKSKYLTKQHNLDDIGHRLKPAYIILAFVAIFIVFTSELKRVVEFNRDKRNAKLVIVTVESCNENHSRYSSASCKVRDNNYNRKYLGLDGARFSNVSPKPGDKIQVYEFPDGSLENDLKISRSYRYLIYSAIGLVLYSSFLVFVIYDQHKKKTTKAKK